MHSYQRTQGPWPRGPLSPPWPLPLLLLTYRTRTEESPANCTSPRHSECPDLETPSSPLRVCGCGWHVCIVVLFGTPHPPWGNPTVFFLFAQPENWPWSFQTWKGGDLFCIAASFSPFRFSPAAPPAPDVAPEPQSSAAAARGRVFSSPRGQPGSLAPGATLGLCRLFI